MQNSGFLAGGICPQMDDRGTCYLHQLGKIFVWKISCKCRVLCEIFGQNHAKLEIFGRGCLPRKGDRGIYPQIRENILLANAI